MSAPPPERNIDPDMVLRSLAPVIEYEVPPAPKVNRPAVPVLPPPPLASLSDRLKQLTRMPSEALPSDDADLQSDLTRINNVDDTNTKENV